MASRTQLRLQQITGSAVDIKTESQGYIVANTVDGLTGSDIQDIFGMIGGALLRIHGASSDEPFNSAEGTFATSVFDVNASAAVTIDSSGGTISVGADNVNQNINIGTDGQREITIGDAAAANSAGLTLRANTGGIDIDCSQSSGALSLDTAGGAIEIGVNAAAGAINIGTDATQRKITIGSATGNTEVEIATGTGGVDVDSTGKINIATSNANADALTIDVSGNGGADITVGNAANDANANLDLVVMNKLNIDVQGTDAADGVEITLGTDTSNAKVIIQNNSGNDALTVDGLLDVQVGRNLTVAGDLTVSGNTVTLDVTNKSIQDQLIILNSGSAADAVDQDVGIIFAKPDISRVLYVDKSDSDKFVFATTYTSGTATGANAVTKLGDAAVKMGALETSGVTNSSLTDNRVVIAGSSGILEDDANFTFDGSDLQLANNIGLVFSTDDAEKIESNGTDLTVSSGGSIILDADTDIELNANGADIIFKDDTAAVGRLINGGAATGFILSSSAGNLLTLDSNGGLVALSQDVEGGGENGAAVVLGNNTLQVEKLSYEPGGHSAFKFVHNDTYASQFLQISGSVRIYKSNAGDRYVGIDVSNPASNYNLTLPDAVAGTANEILCGDTSGNLSFKTQAELGIGGSVTKAIKILSSAAAAGADVLFNSVTAGSTIGDFALTEDQGADLDVFVNGQLLVSGSASERGAGTRDYNIKNVNTLNFAFGLEIDDVIQVIKR